DHGRPLTVRLPAGTGVKIDSWPVFPVSRLDPILEQGPALETAAEQAAAAAPPSTAWPLIRRLHTDLERDLDSAQRGARARDVDAAAHQAAQAREVTRRPAPSSPP
ncbi:hypothetical protein, partial [Nonomuraea sp. NPDC050202]|uniref:hypothetical protein n=1 Tax=Nonomuraea sp. NPDC050202 TaxID=3155035 RepID=UPI0033F7D90C